MTIYSYVTFTTLVLIMVYSPGPMTMFLMANGMQKSFRESWPILVGANHAYLLSIVMFSVGLTSLLQKNILVLKVVQIIGIMYLLYLAYTQWRRKQLTNSAKILIGNYKSWCSLYLKGAFIAFSNPKTILFFSIVFPQFISGDRDVFSQGIILSLTFLILQFSSGCIYFLFGRSMRGTIEIPEFQNMINKISAVILVIVAGFLSIIQVA